MFAYMKKPGGQPGLVRCASALDRIYVAHIILKQQVLVYMRLVLIYDSKCDMNARISHVILLCVNQLHDYSKV